MCSPYTIWSDVGKFIIPKGTEYIENDNGEIVSSCIKWTGSCLNSKDILYNKEHKKFRSLCVGL